MTTHAPAAFSPQRIGIVGAGPMGLSLAAMLGRTLSVTIVARDPARARRLARDGAIVTGLITAASRPRIAQSIVRLTDSAPLDAIFVATKTTAIDAVADELRPILGALAGPHGPPYVISFQNGIESGRALMQRLGHSRVLRMVLNYGAIFAAENAAQVTHNQPPHSIGGPDPTHTLAAHAFADAITACGLETRAVDNIEPLVWRKGLLNAAMNPVAALTDSRVGEVLDSPARTIVALLIEEGLTVAAAEGIDLGPAAATQMWQTLEAARSHLPSMVSDIRDGRPSEVGQLNRQVVEHAAHAGVRTPSHEIIAALIDAFDWRVFHRDAAARRPPPGSRRSL